MSYVCCCASKLLAVVRCVLGKEAAAAEYRSSNTDEARWHALCGCFQHLTVEGMRSAGRNWHQAEEFELPSTVSSDSVVSLRQQVAERVGQKPVKAGRDHEVDGANRIVIHRRT